VCNVDELINVIPGGTPPSTVITVSLPGGAATDFVVVVVVVILRSRFSPFAVDIDISRFNNKTSGVSTILCFDEYSDDEAQEMADRWKLTQNWKSHSL
jgi:hypothetical protein